MLVFVYGTLKRGFANHRVMEMAGGKFVDIPGIIGPGNMDMISLGPFPALVDWSDDTLIYGEFYDVRDIGPIDRLEGVPNFYHRREISAEIEGCGAIKFWTYFLTRPNDEYIDSRGIQIKKQGGYYYKTWVGM